jgi:hypothetical protein
MVNVNAYWIALWIAGLTPNASESNYRTTSDMGAVRMHIVYKLNPKVIVPRSDID